MICSTNGEGQLERFLLTFYLLANSTCVHYISVLWNHSLNIWKKCTSQVLLVTITQDLLLLTNCIQPFIEVMQTCQCCLGLNMAIENVTKHQGVGCPFRQQGLLARSTSGVLHYSSSVIFYIHKYKVICYIAFRNETLHVSLRDNSARHIVVNDEYECDGHQYWKQQLCRDSRSGFCAVTCSVLPERAKRAAVISAACSSPGLLLTKHSDLDT